MSVMLAKGFDWLSFQLVSGMGGGTRVALRKPSFQSVLVWWARWPFQRKEDLAREAISACGNHEGTEQEARRPCLQLRMG